jgi:hypothetical protein
VHPRLGYFGVSRATKDSSFGVFSVGIGGIASVDLWRESTFAAVLGFEPTLDGLLAVYAPDSDNAALPGVTGFVAVRWRDAIRDGGRESAAR